MISPLLILFSILPKKMWLMGIAHLQFINKIENMYWWKHQKNPRRL